MVYNSKIGFVGNVMALSGMTFANTTNSYNATPLAVMNNTEGAVNNIAMLGNIIEQMQVQQQAQAGPSPAMGAVMTAGVMALGATAAVFGGPAAGQVALEVGTALTGSVMNHAGLKGNNSGLRSNAGSSMGELTMAGADAATAFENGVYVSAFGGATDIMTGKTVASPALGQAAPPMARGQHNVGAIGLQVAAGMDKADVIDDFRAALEKNKLDISQNMHRLKVKEATNDPNFAANDAKFDTQELDNNLAIQKPAVPTMIIPRAFGMA